MADKAFEFASKRASGAKIAGNFTINGEQFTVRVLGDSHIAYLVANVNGGAEPTKAITHVLNFTEKALLPESAQRFERLVLDPEAGLSMAEVMEVFQHVLTLVAGGEGAPDAPVATPRKRAAATR